ncbi:MAG: membrane integrity-associated transporter subunit PqiC [Verrucomicrobiota bacterium]
MNPRAFLVVALLAAAAAGAGCSLLPAPKPDPTRFFVLAAEPGEAAPARGSVVLRPVEVPAYLRQPALVVRRGGHEVAFREAARWGEPLEQGLARVLGENLRRLGLAPAQRGGEADAAALVVRVLAAEGTAAGGVEFRAAWELTRRGAAPVGGEFRAAGLTWDGRDEAGLAAGLSAAVAGLAAEISGQASPAR